MLWPLVFIRFVLASTVRHDDVLASTTPHGDAVGPGSAAALDGAHRTVTGQPRAEGAPPPGFYRIASGTLDVDAGAPPGVAVAANELHCRMFGVAKERGVPCGQAAEEGCGCPVQVPESLENIPPPFQDGDGTYYVGWEGTHDESTAITYSFEKEWLGHAPELHRLYRPAGYGVAGEHCDELWDQLDDQAKEEFMAAFRAKASRGAFAKYLKRGQDKCFIGDNRLPLRRTRPDLSISDLIEVDGDAWEVKAATFHYNLKTMEEQVREMVRYLGVPGVPPDDDGFPAERRIQVHVVASLKREGGRPPAENKALLSNLRLIQLYFSDFLFLRLGFTWGPRGEKCSSISGERFQCDVFSDSNNVVISEEHANMAWNAEEQGPVDADHKFEIVGLRDSECYDGAENNACTGNAEDDCKKPYRVGFEIRKSESFASALEVAEAISHALSSMNTDGTAKVGMRYRRDIEDVRVYAQSHRLKDFPDCPICENKNMNFRSFTTSAIAAIADKPQRRVLAVSRYATYLEWLQNKRANAAVKVELWSMMALLLCTDWTFLVDVDTGDKRTNILKMLEKLDGQENSDNGEGDIGQFRGQLESLHEAIVEYAYELSNAF